MGKSSNMEMGNGQGMEIGSVNVVASEKSNLEMWTGQGMEMVAMGKGSIKNRNMEMSNGQGRETGSGEMVAREKGNMKNSCMELATGQGRKMGSVEMVAMGKNMEMVNGEKDNFGLGSVEMTKFPTINGPLRLRGGGCDSDSDDIIIEDIDELDDSVIIISEHDICSVQESESHNNYEVEETKERKCDFCQKDIKSLIPHLKNTERCRDFHFETYLTQNKSNSIVENLKQLGVIINNIRKLEAQKRKRKNADYVKEYNRKRKTQRQARNTDASKCCKDYFNTVKEIMSKTCDCCSCFFSPQKLEKIEPETSKPSEQPVTSLYLCSLCKRLNDELKHIREFEQEETKYSTEYENWAETHFSLERRINELQKVFHEKNLKVSMKIYNDQEGRHTVLFPSNLNVLETAEKCDGLEDSEPTVLLPQDCFEEPQLKTISREEAELANQSCDKPFLTQLSVVIEDKLATMELKKRWRENLNLEIKVGRVNDNSILLKEKNSLEGCLSSVKGTKDYLANLKEEMDARQRQNGFKNIQIMWPVFAGFEQIMSDPFLALCLLRMNGHAITCVETESDGIVQNYKMTCGEDCLPFDCEHTDKHQTPIEKLISMEYDINPFTVARFLIEKTEAFVDKIIRPIADNFSLFLSFDRPSGAGGDSGFVLVGNIWLEEISESDNEDHPIPEVLLTANVKKMLGEGYGRIGITNELSNWTPNCYSQEPDITERTEKIIKVDNCRETSIFEAILTSTRKSKLQWSSQTVKHIDTEDPRKVTIEVAPRNNLNIFKN